jgi:hypothetical protein
MKNLRFLALGASASAAAMFVASPANATIALCYYTGNDVPQCAATDSNVNVDNTQGFVIGGHLNDDVTQQLTFTGSETLVGAGSGQATITALDDLLDTAVTFQLIGATFNLATFNLVPLTGNDPNEAVSVEVSYIPTFGGSPITYTLSGNGENFYGIYGDAGEQIQSITFGNYLPAGSGIASIKQVRLGGVRPTETPTPEGVVPEPGTWAMMLIGFGAIGAGMRRRRKQGVRARFSYA